MPAVVVEDLVLPEGILKRRHGGYFCFEGLIVEGLEDREGKVGYFDPDGQVVLNLSLLDINKPLAVVQIHDHI